MTSSQGFSKTLRDRVHSAAALLEFVPPSGTFSISAETYSNYLILLHQIIRASVPLMQAAVNSIHRIPDERSATRSIFKEYMEMHIDEERGHDEWLLDDLASIGIPTSSALSILPPAEISDLVGSQYYYVYHVSPFAILGYIAILESFPPPLAWLQRVAEVTKLPRSAFRTLEFHSEADPHHVDDLFNLIGDLKLTTLEQRLVSYNMISTLSRLAILLRSFTSTMPAIPSQQAVG